MKNENRILVFINGYKTFVWNHGFYGQRNRKEMKIIINNYSAHAAAKFLHSTAILVLFGDQVVCIRSFAVFASTSKTASGFEYAGE